MKKLLLALAILFSVALHAGQGMGPGPGLVTYSGGGGGCANIVPSILAARTSGTAPLHVFLDGSGTTDSGVTTRPFHDLKYTWDYGDTGAGTWATGTRPSVNSKNASLGPMGGHIYETAGSYTVTLTVYDGTDTCSTTQGITVADPNTTFAGTATVCIGNILPVAGVGGCPTGAAAVLSADFDAALGSCAGTTKRCLFKKGDTFTASTTTTITATGPGLIGAFGSGANPQINSSGSFGDNPIIEFGSSSTVTQKDWRVMDLTFDGNGSAEAVGMGGGFDQVTLLRLTARDCGDACIFFNSAVLNVGSNPHLFEQAAVVDCDLAEPTSWGLFFNAKNFSIMGNTIDSSTGSHTLRISIAINGVVENNTMGPNGVGSAGNHVMKLHAPPFGSATDGVPINTRTQKIMVSYNKLTPGNNSTNNWTMAIDPQDDTEDERIADVIVEGNAFTAGTNTVNSIELQGVDITIRDNVSNNSGASAGCGCFMEIDRRSTAAPAPTGVVIDNNSMYTSINNLNDSDTPFIIIRSSVASGGVTAKNNLGYAPNATGTNPLMFLDEGSGNTLSNNTTNAQMKTNPNFTTSPPLLLGDYKITSGYGVGGGASVPNWYDALGVGWQPTWDIGAVKH